jgi:transposase
MPPSVRDWLPVGHLAWFVIETVEQLDLVVFYADYRADGHGRAAYDPSMMVSLVLFAYSTGERSSRGIERHCRQDIAYRVITGNRVPDHATVARCIVRHEQRLGELFGLALRLCAKRGLAASGVVAIDGTKLVASAASDSNVDYDRIARGIIGEAIKRNQVENEEHGDALGDESHLSLRLRLGDATGSCANWSANVPARVSPRTRKTTPKSSPMRIRWTGRRASAELGGMDARDAPSTRRAAHKLQGRSRGHVSSVCGWLPGGWKTISQPRSEATRQIWAPPHFEWVRLELVPG